MQDRYQMPEHTILQAMRVFGGSFVKTLAELYQRADDVNRGRLEAAFGDYFAKYDGVAVEVARRELEQ